jgi:hypothetical protein
MINSIYAPNCKLLPRFSLSICIQEKIDISDPDVNEFVIWLTGTDGGGMTVYRGENITVARAVAEALRLGAHSLSRYLEDV